MTTSTAAKTLNVTPRHVRYLIRHGIISAELHGRDHWCDPNSVKLYLRNRKKPGRPKRN